MIVSLDRKHLDDEVRLISRTNAANPLATPISPEALVCPLPPSRFRLPVYLAATAPGALHAELVDLFDELRSVHDGHVGERVLDVAAYYAITGAKADLGKRIRAWTECYFRLRTFPENVTPALRKDPFSLFEDRVEEAKLILDELARADNAVTPIFVGQTVEFVPWLLYSLLWRDRVRVTPHGLRLDYVPVDETVPLRMAIWLRLTPWCDGYFRRFLDRLAVSIPARDLEDLQHQTDADHLRSLADMAADCQRMRSRLLDVPAHEAAIHVSDQYAVGWAWGGRHGIASLVTGSSIEAVRANGCRFASPDPVAVGYDGVLIDARMPWISFRDCDPVSGIRPLVRNHYVLERLHAKLVLLYDRGNGRAPSNGNL